MYLQRIPVFRYEIFSADIQRKAEYFVYKYSLQIHKEKLNFLYLNILCRYIKKS